MSRLTRNSRFTRIILHDIFFELERMYVTVLSNKKARLQRLR